MWHARGVKGRFRGRWRSAVTAAMLCLALAACGRSAGATPRAAATVAATSTPSPTATPAITVIQSSGPPVNGAAVAWQHANLPAGFGMHFDAADTSVAASAGMTAYSCGPGAGRGKTQVIVTHDGGASWVRVADAPVGGSGCQFIMVDKLNPSIVVCCQYTSGPQAISTDGGASWHMGSSTYVVLWPVTVGARTYAILGYNVASGQQETLGESDDGLRTWQTLDTPRDSGSNYRGLWLNPATGALLLDTLGQAWSSTDGGQHWSEVQRPATGLINIAVQQSTVAQPWRICGTSNAIVCTRDAGATWTQEPPIAPGGQVALQALVGMPADGSLLAISLTTVYRLPAGATQWQNLGAIQADSNGELVYAASSAGGGSLWSFPVESDGAGGYEPIDAIYSAAYPY